MMVSPEGFIIKYIDKSYSELLPLRDELIREIHYFEKYESDQLEEIVCPSPEVVYQCNLEYLAKLCELIAQKYNQEFINFANI